MKIQTEDKQTLEENIRFIKKIMHDTKRAQLNTGPIIILWGIMVTIAQSSTFILIKAAKPDFIWPMWGIIASVGAVLSFFLLRRYKSLHTFSEKILSSIWFAFGISAAIFIFVSPLGKSGIDDLGTGINPVICLLLGMAYQLTGIVYDRIWIKCISFCWWAGAILLFIWQGVHSYLIFAVFMLLFQVLPGIKLYCDYRKELALHED